MRVTLKQVAERAQTTPATVSLVLNSKQYHRVSEETRKRIQQIAQEMNYLPNLRAQALAKGKTKNIGVLVNALSNPFYNQYILENNQFYQNEMGAIKIETGYTFNSWSEGYGANNIVIRNNTFDTVNPTGVKNDGKERDVFLGVYMKNDPSVERTRYPILSNILFEGNVFKDTFGLVAFISSAGNVTFRDNTFLNVTGRKSPHPYRGNFFVTDAQNVKIVNNRYVASPHVPNPGVQIHEESTENIIVEGNTVVDDAAERYFPSRKQPSAFSGDTASQ